MNSSLGCDKISLKSRELYNFISLFILQFIINLTKIFIRFHWISYCMKRVFFSYRNEIGWIRFLIQKDAKRSEIYEKTICSFVRFCLVDFVLKIIRKFTTISPWITLIRRHFLISIWYSFNLYRIWHTLNWLRLIKFDIV